MSIQNWLIIFKRKKYIQYLFNICKTNREEVNVNRRGRRVGIIEFDQKLINDVQKDKIDPAVVLETHFYSTFLRGLCKAD